MGLMLLNFVKKDLLNFTKKNWKYIVIILLGIGLYSYGKYESKQEVNRLLNNMKQLTQEYQTQVLEIKDKEQKKYLLEKDTLAAKIIDSLNLRPVKIKRVINTKYIHIHDTVFVKLIPDKQDTTFKTFNHVFDPCLSIKGSLYHASSTNHPASPTADSSYIFSYALNVYGFI